MRDHPVAADWLLVLGLGTVLVGLELRAVGMTRPQLRSAVRWESVLIALFGTGLGLVIGIAFGSAMVLSLADDGFGDVIIPGGQLAVIALFAALCGIAAAILPARRASRLDVLSAIATA